MKYSGPYIMVALLFLLFVGWVVAKKQDVRLQEALAANALLQKDLSIAQSDAAGWKKSAEAKDRAATAQAELPDACLKREAQAQADRDSIADIMATAKPQPITPEQAKQGVDDATRTRAVDMLNRPW